MTAVELLPVHHHVDEWHLVKRKLTNYWGYNTLAYFAPELRYSVARTPGGSVREFKMMVRALHAAGLEVILDVVYNHTGEGNQLGPTLSLRGIDNVSYYRLVAAEPALLRGLHRQRQHAEHAQPARAAADHGQPAVLGARDARRRVPLRPRERARARAARGRSTRRVLRHHPPGPGAVAGEADRRAVGPRRGRLPGRQLPGRLDRVERQVPRLGAAVLARRRRPGVRVRDAAGGQQRPLRAAAGGARTRASTSSPRTTGSRCATWSATTTKHNEANGEDNRDGENNNLS